METLRNLIRRLVVAFRDVKLEYALTGALAVSFYGVPRSTVDIDIIVRIFGKKDMDRLISALRNAKLKVDEKALGNALKSGYRIFTIRDEKTPYSVDIIISEKKIRRRPGVIANVTTFFQEPEELILAKLRMIKATVPRNRTIKDVEDIKGILKFTKVNLKKIKAEAEKDKTLKILEEILVEK
ncbi:MAG: nucleotidyl transferase AbiEii/AbiGii toxin family protein [Thermoproteota archaeon]|nr:nucleotidyl transferase AbiEii/AbiGii toxin family protein [Candidatus Brockarchaeota archaeon]